MPESQPLDVRIVPAGEADLPEISRLAGVVWQTAQQSTPGMTQYITQLEVAYAVHELVYGILFLLILAIPFRQGARWAWWACWAVLLANLTYAFTFGAHDSIILLESLALDILIPVLLLVQIPRFFGDQREIPRHKMMHCRGSYSLQLLPRYCKHL